MTDRWWRKRREKTRATFKVSNQTVSDGVNKEVSNKHTVFTLLLTLNRGVGGREGGRQKEAIMGFECKWQKRGMLCKEIKGDCNPSGKRKPREDEEEGATKKNSAAWEPITFVSSIQEILKINKYYSFYCYCCFLHYYCMIKTAAWSWTTRTTTAAIIAAASVL